MTNKTQSTFAVATVTGADAKTFLQAQFSNDVELIKPGHCQLNGYCNPKGRLLATFYLGLHDENYYLICDQTVMDALVKRLRMYVLRADVAFSFLPSQVLAFANAQDVSASEDTLVFNAPAPLDCLLAICLEDAATELAADASTVNLNQRMIQLGVPMISAGTQESFIPQDVNLDLAGGVSFTKGCYPGQEIVARVHYRGKAKNRMFYATVESAEPVEVGTAVFAEDRESQKSGEVAGVYDGAADGKYLQLVLPVANAAERRFYLEDNKSATIEICAQPYALEPAS